MFAGGVARGWVCAPGETNTKQCVTSVRDLIFSWFVARVCGCFRAYLGLLEGAVVGRGAASRRVHFVHGSLRACGTRRRFEKPHQLMLAMLLNFASLPELVVGLRTAVVDASCVFVC